MGLERRLNNDGEGSCGGAILIPLAVVYLLLGSVLTQFKGTLSSNSTAGSGLVLGLVGFGNSILGTTGQLQPLSLNNMTITLLLAV